METIAKLIKLTNPDTVIPMHTEMADSFSGFKEFADWKEKVHVLNDEEEYLVV